MDNSHLDAAGEGDEIGIERADHDPRAGQEVCEREGPMSLREEILDRIDRHENMDA